MSEITGPQMTDKTCAWEQVVLLHPSGEGRYFDAALCIIGTRWARNERCPESRGLAQLNIGTLSREGVLSGLPRHVTGCALSSIMACSAWHSAPAVDGVCTAVQS